MTPPFFNIYLFKISRCPLNIVSVCLINNSSNAFFHTSKETCFRLYADNVDSTFIKFDILNYPYVKDNMNLNSDAFKLYLHIKDFFDNNKIDENEKDLLAFKRNCEALGSRLFDVISVDFTFIKKLNTTFDEKLNHNLNRTVNEFKKNLLL